MSRTLSPAGAVITAGAALAEFEHRHDAGLFEVPEIVALGEVLGEVCGELRAHPEVGGCARPERFLELLAIHATQHRQNRGLRSTSRPNTPRLQEF